MEKVIYFATIFVFKDGELQVSMPCLKEEHCIKRVCQYGEEDKVRIRVVREGLPPFWLTMKEEERLKHALPPVNDPATKLMRDLVDECRRSRNETEINPFTSVGYLSDIFFDYWKSQSKKTKF